MLNKIAEALDVAASKSNAGGEQNCQPAAGPQVKEKIFQGNHLVLTAHKMLLSADQKPASKCRDRED